MNKINNGDLIKLHKILSNISRETAEAISILNQSIDVEKSGYNPDEYLKKWLSSSDVQPKSKEVNGGDK